MNDDRDEIMAMLQRQPAFPPTDDNAIMPPPLAPLSDLTDSFVDVCKKNGNEVRMLDDIAALPAAVAGYLRQHELPSQLVCDDTLLGMAWGDFGVDATCRAAKDGDTCGATRIIAADARTGAMLQTSETAHRLTINLLPPHYVAIVHAADILSDLAAVWRRTPQPLPRCCHLVCGPSRTADIEQTLTLGMHGPVAVLVAVIR